MTTLSKLSALLLGAALATGMGGCKKQAEDISPAPVTTPNTATPAATTPPAAEPAPVTPPPATPAPDTTPPPAGGTAPGTSGTSGTQGTTGSGQPPSTAPDRIDQREPQRDRRPGY
jgi:hypothetical protein